MPSEQSRADCYASHLPSLLVTFYGHWVVLAAKDQSSDYFLDYSTMHVGEAAVDSVVSIGQLRVIES